MERTRSATRVFGQPEPFEQLLGQTVERWGGSGLEYDYTRWQAVIAFSLGPRRYRLRFEVDPAHAGAGPRFGSDAFCYLVKVLDEMAALADRTGYPPTLLLAGFEAVDTAGEGAALRERHPPDPGVA